MTALDQGAPAPARSTGGVRAPRRTHLAARTCATGGGIRVASEGSGPWSCASRRSWREAYPAATWHASCSSARRPSITPSVDLPQARAHAGCGLASGAKRAACELADHSPSLGRRRGRLVCLAARTTSPTTKHTARPQSHIRRPSHAAAPTSDACNHRRRERPPGQRWRDRSGRHAVVLPGAGIALASYGKAGAPTLDSYPPSYAVAGGADPAPPGQRVQAAQNRGEQHKWVGSASGHGPPGPNWR